jgi:hypothetical protein
VTKNVSNRTYTYFISECQNRIGLNTGVCGSEKEIEKGVEEREKGVEEGGDPSSYRWIT